MSFYRIADLNVEMDTFGRTARQSEAYRISEAPVDIVIQTDKETACSRYPNFSEDDREYMETAGAFYRRLLDFGGMMLHASAVVCDDRAYLFSAPSRTGKSTHTQLWLKEFPGRSYILNDDKPAIRWIDDICYAYGTPWSGKTDLNRNEKVKLGGVVILERSQTNYAVPLRGMEAIYGMLDQTFRPYTQERTKTLMSLIGRLVSEGFVYRAGVNMQQEAAAVVYRVLHGGV